ncbi:Alkylphosphocholine resistance protein LEM3 [Wickerhamomyces ciferrii]|uniref:Alkylphosphocholine resistance protein LEM3 n=1 Tax=Wickerhamomyces ciferrii (strain ATCC 14091 / BCRC 22168 / CBS 111 / JCM 3599 / NBRC 0793 / NRRL Y-1031 F-60-10) TaxID=1206466 RepID=K0KU90_WICCF|nr:Alkylphosphocholine resistance protein LEM3 [Wickerhamomyces ciferrii]CCH45587.1 Alkylphosphocholine resistance protein LEM3 [Wickerhamomyces ciferrii]
MALKSRNLFHRNKKTVDQNQDSDSDSVSEDETPIIKKEKSRRPKENNFTQQKLKAIHPIITPKYVIPLFLILAVIFIPLGAGMLYGSYKVEDLTIDYTECDSQSNSFETIPDDKFEANFKNEFSTAPKWKYSKNSSSEATDEQGICNLQFTIPNDIGPAVFLLYRLENFYANHRRFARSYSEDQLNGEDASIKIIKDTVGQNCEPLSLDENGKRIYPCGLIANSFFNDTFKGLSSSDGSDYEMTNKGIAWATNKNRFKKTKYKASEIVPPPNWKKMYPDGYTDDNIPDISKWSEFQNWMQIPGLSTFSKLVLRNDDEVLKAGTYEVEIGMNWPVKEFNGKKSIYLTTRSVIGGRNPFLGIAWIVAGGICLILSIVFLIINLVVPRKMGDVSLLSWNQQPVKLEEDN